MVKKRGIIKWILLSIMSIWIIVSVFFYFQHRIQVDRYYVGKYIEFDDFSVLVKNIERYNFEQNGRNYPDEILKLNLPWKITLAILKINYFYSQPYHINNESYKYEVNCEIIFNPEFIDSENVTKKISDTIGIYLYQDATTSLKEPTGNKIAYESNKNVMHFMFSGKWQENYSKGLKIINNDNGEEYVIPIEKPYVANTYGYFNRRVDDAQQMASDIINQFLWEYYNGKIKDAEIYIKEECVENFHWNILDQYEKFRSDNYQFSYLGRFMDEEQVFIMKVTDDDLMKDLNFYLIYRDFDWQIINVE